MDALGDAQRDEWPLLSTRPALALDRTQDVIHLELAPPPACPLPTIPHSDEDIFPPYQSDHSFLLPKIWQKQQSGHLKPSWSVPTNSISCFISPYVLPPWSCMSVILSYFHGVCKNVMLFACVSIFSRMFSLLTHLANTCILQNQAQLSPLMGIPLTTKIELIILLSGLSLASTIVLISVYYYLFI